MPYVYVKKESISLYATLQNTHIQMHTYKQSSSLITLFVLVPLFYQVDLYLPKLSGSYV